MVLFTAMFYFEQYWEVHLWLLIYLFVHNKHVWVYCKSFIVFVNIWLHLYHYKEKYGKTFAVTFDTLFYCFIFIFFAGIINFTTVKMLCLTYIVIKNLFLLLHIYWFLDSFIFLQDADIDYSANSELKKLQFFGAGPKAAVPGSKGLN